jgi:hypothetical protein
MANWWGDGAKPTKAEIAARGKANKKALAQMRAGANRRAAIELLGSDELIASLTALKDTIQSNTTEKSLKKASQVTRRAIKAQVPVSTKWAKRMVGIFVGLKIRNKEWQSKVGLGVGKRTKSNTESRRSGNNTYKSKDGSIKFKGVGISVSNIHWPVLGTKSRSSKRPKRSTGAMQQMIPDAVINGWNGSKSEFLNVFRHELKAGLEKIAAKELAKSGN